MNTLTDVYNRLETVYPLDSELLNLAYVANYDSFLYSISQLQAEASNGDITPKWRKLINKYLNLVDGEVLSKSSFSSLPFADQIKYLESCIQMSEGASVVNGEAFESEYQEFVEERYEGINPEHLSYDGFEYHVDYCDSGIALNRTFRLSTETVTDLLTALDGLTLCEDQSLTSLVTEHLEFELALALYVEKYDPDSVEIAINYTRQLWSAIYDATRSCTTNQRLQQLRDVIGYELSPVSSPKYVF